MTTRPIPGEEAYAIGCAGQAESDGNTAPPTQPGREEKSKGEPAKPTGKPLPDLPNPAEVGEDG